MSSTQKFAYASSTPSQTGRFGFAFICLTGAVWFLLRAEASSLFEQRHGMLTDSQNLAGNVIVAFGLSVIGFLALVQLARNTQPAARFAEVTPDVLRAPDQGRFGSWVEIPLKDIVTLEQLSVDGIWEAVIASPEARIRIPKASLADPEDFDRMLRCIETRAPQCHLTTVERINPPEIMP